LGCSGAAWDPALRCLARRPLGQPVVAPDLPGYGRSPGPREALGIDDLADWAAHLLAALGIARAYVAGNSMGCQVALALARRRPERVGGLVLVGPTTGERVPLWRYALGLLADGRHEPLRYNAALVRMYSQMGIPRFLATTRKMLDDDPLGQAGAVAAPCLVLWGRDDRIIPERAARRLAKTLPRGSFLTVEGAAHAVQFNKPDSFVEIALAFLAGAEAAMDRSHSVRER
jgi:pimeloyl-ACP methyl ester carboxylesterase